jgi:hypothetical protein
MVIKWDKVPSMKAVVIKTPIAVIKIKMPFEKKIGRSLVEK